MPSTQWAALSRGHGEIVSDVLLADVKARAGQFSPQTIFLFLNLIGQGVKIFGAESSDHGSWY